MALVVGAILTVLVSGSASVGLRGRRQLGAGSNVLRHFDQLDERAWKDLERFKGRCSSGKFAKRKRIEAGRGCK